MRRTEAKKPLFGMVVERTSRRGTSGAAVSPLWRISSAVVMKDPAPDITKLLVLPAAFLMHHITVVVRPAVTVLTKWSWSVKGFASKRL